MNIAYCLEGTRRGHAARAIAVGKELFLRGHTVRFFTDRDALALLQEAFGPACCHDTPMPTYVEHNGSIRPWRTVWKNRAFLLHRTTCADTILNHLSDRSMDLVLSDFEPLGAAVAQKFQIPLVSLNSQNFIGQSRHARLPIHLRLKLQGISHLTRCLCPWPNLRIASKAFVQAKRGSRTHIVGPCIRPELQQLPKIRTESLVLAYLQNSQIQDALNLQSYCRKRGLELRLYGLKNPPLSLEEVVQPPSFSGFNQALRSCRFLVCSAGSQLLGEAAHLGIPTLIRPEPNQPEQNVNAHLASAQIPYFTYVRKRTLTETDIETLHTTPPPHPCPQPEGSSEACNIIEQWMLNFQTTGLSSLE